MVTYINHNSLWCRSIKFAKELQYMITSAIVWARLDIFIPKSRIQIYPFLEFFNSCLKFLSSLHNSLKVDPKDLLGWDLNVVHARIPGA